MGVAPRAGGADWPTGAAPALDPDRVGGRLFRFTSTSAAWLDAAETVFAELTRRRLGRGVFGSLVEPQAAVHRFVAEHNREPEPFVWTADPDRIIEKIGRGHQASDQIR